MDVRGYAVAVLLVLLCTYGLDRCLSGFRRTRGSGTVKPYFYGLGIAVALGVIGLVLVGLFLAFVGPLH